MVRSAVLGRGSDLTPCGEAARYTLTAGTVINAGLAVPALLWQILPDRAGFRGWRECRPGGKERC